MSDKTLGAIREIIMQDAFGDRSVMEESETVPEIDINKLIMEQQLAFKKRSTKERNVH